MTKNLFLLLLVASFGFYACGGNKSNTEEAVTTTDNVFTFGDFSGKKSIDIEESAVEWEGYKPTGTHNGTVAFQNGTLSFENGKIVGGEFVLDMTSIEVLDLDGDYKASLEAHLRGTDEGKEDHFFDTQKYPTAKVKVNDVVGVEEDENANLMIYADLEIKGVSNTVVFKAMASENDGTLNFKSTKFNIDRTQWGIQYQSKSIFTDLADQFINDEIGLQITVSIP
jgi:polyisoprenoid-binding protein YceI